MSYLMQSNVTTVKDLLELPFTNDFELLAGKDGLDNAVSGGNIMDNPNALDWFTAGEVLVTSGYFLTENPETQLENLKLFKKLNLSAIFIKSFTFFDKIPTALIEHCNTLAIPLVEVPYGITFSKIINDITNYLASNVNYEKQLAIDSHNRFFKTALNGGGIETLVEDLHLLVNNTAIVVDSTWDILAYEGIESESLTHYTISNESIKFDVDALEDLPTKIHEINHIIHRNFDKNEKSTSCAIMPIYFNTINYGYIIIISSLKKLTNLDHIVLESASMALALQISQKEETNRNNNRIVRDFFKNLLSGQKIDPNILKNVGLHVDYKYQYSFIIMNIDINHNNKYSYAHRKKIDTDTMKKIFDDMKWYTEDKNIDLQFFKQGNKLFGIYKKRDGESIEENKKKEKEFFENLLRFIHSRVHIDIDIKVMIGSYQPLEELKVSYDEAVKIESFSLDPKQHVFFYDEFYLELFLAKYIGSEASEDFYQYYLTPLIKYDEANNSELINTLRAFLNNQFNIADTTRTLFVHRNTTLYRLEKIKDILGVDITSPRISLALNLAFEFYDRQALIDTLL